MALLTSVPLARTGVRIDTGAAAAAGGDTFQNTGNEFLSVRNGSAASINVTITGVTVSNAVVAVPAAATLLIGPFPPGSYNDAQGRVAVAYSAAASVVVQVLRNFVPDAETSY